MKKETKSQGHSAFLLMLVIGLICGLTCNFYAQTSSSSPKAEECPELYFEIIGDLPGDCILTQVSDISADGSRVALMSSADEPGVPNDGGACDPYLGWPHSNEAAGWTRPCKNVPFFTPPNSGTGGLVGFGYLAGANPAHNESIARGISPDGKVVAGYSNFRPDNNTKAVVITGLGMQGLAVLDSGCIAVDISGNGGLPSFIADPDLEGRIIVGYSNTLNQYASKLPGARAVYWDDRNHVVPLPLPLLLPNDSSIISSEANCISDDGRIIGGNLFYNKKASPGLYMSYPCVWILSASGRSESVYSLSYIMDDLPGGDDCAMIRSSSGNGKVFVGSGSMITGNPSCWGYLTTACKWTLPSLSATAPVMIQPLALPDLNGFAGSYALGANYDGSVISGSCINITGPCNDQTFDNRAVIWHAEFMSRPPDDISILLADKIPEGYVPYEVVRISSDSKTITGMGFDPDYNVFGWVARLPVSETVPLADWSLMLGIGFMVIVSVFLFWKRNR